MRGVIGLTTIIGFAYLISTNKKAINWRIVITGLLLQTTFAVIVLKWEPAFNALNFVSAQFIQLLNFTKEGTAFLVGYPLMDPSNSWGYIFAFQVLPTIVFFSALTSVLYYLRILQWVVFCFAWVMKKTMNLSGAESLAAAANIFIGQTEAPLVVKPYIGKMTRSEILTLMSGGMATIAGGVLVAYIGMLGGSDEEAKLMFATHFITASILSAPASLLLAKMVIPETEEINHEMKIEMDNIGTSLLDAITHGTSDGIKLAINIGGILLVFTALIAMLNYITAGIGSITGLNDLITEASDGRYTGLTVQYILGLVFSPVAWLIGVPKEDLMIVGQLLGERTILNEFFAYATMSDLKTAGAFSSQKSITITTYALCGFANIVSIGIQITGISILAPEQRSNLADLGVKAITCATLACLMTACLAGILV